MTVNFVIPMERENLLTADSLDQYVVTNVLNIRDLKPKLKEIEFEINSNGSYFVEREWFDVFYSVLSRFHEDLPSSIKSTAHDCLVIAGEHLITRVDNILNEEEPDTNQKAECLTDMKMIVYLLTQLSELIERETIEKASLLAGKKKKDDELNWENSRMKCIHFMYKILQLGVNRLFTPPVAEEDFINCFANAAFRTLENPIMAHQRNRNVRLSVIQVLGTLNSRFDYSLSCSFKLVQELKLFEHMVSPLAEAVEVFVNEFGTKSVVMEIIQEISRLDLKELSRDTSATKSYSLFLVELTERLPELVRPSLSLLIVHLDGESYMMRKSILSILGEIVMKVLSKEDLDDSSKDNRNQFLEYLEDHIHDINAHVRSAVLSIWSKLCCAKSIPLRRQYSVLKLTVGRLQDKSSNVRKQSVQLLTSLLQCNPYTFSLPIEELESQLSVESKKLDELDNSLCKQHKKWEEEGGIEMGLKELLESEDYDEENLPEEAVWDGASQGEISERIINLLSRNKLSKAIALLLDARTKFPDDFNSEEEIISALKEIYLKPSKNDASDEELLSKQKVLVAYLKDSVLFGKLMNESLPMMVQLLGSKQSSDVLEAIDFFVTAFEFGLLNAMMGVRKMLSLIWSNETVVKEAVVKAYKRLYIDIGTSSGGASQIVKNLIALVRGSTVGECASLEALVGMLVDSKDIGKDCFQILWQIFTLVMPDCTEESSCDAITLIGMIGLKEPSVVSSNVKIIVEHAFGERGMKNFRLVTESCKALMKIIPPQKSDSTEIPFRFDSNDLLFESLHKIIVEGISQKHDYIPMVKAAITVIYELSEHPDKRMGEIAFELVSSVANNNCNKLLELKRLVYVAGQIAVAQLKHLDISVFCEMKRRNHLREMKQEKKRKRKSVCNVPTSASETPRNNHNEEDDLIGAEGDDAEAEFIRNICENEIVTGGNLLSHFVPLLLDICSNQEYDDSLKTSVALSLSKFMLVSNEFCDQHLRLLFTLLEKCKNETTRANMIIAAGDLSVRFPNTLEPWTPRMYARLRDESPLVRSNTLTVLTHLILNDMIKVKGQIADMALCIIDKAERISSLAKLFFTELARKGNSLYNVMPDIVSRLSSPEVGVPEEEFREIMKFIICLIEKDKHLESLVEKMCHRFRVTKTERQWRDLAYCLSSFNFNDKAVKKLNDNFNCYSDKLYIKEVYESLSTILVHAKKTVKNETKVVIEELEKKIEEAHERGVEDHTANERACKAKEVDAEVSDMGESKLKENVSPVNKQKAENRINSDEGGKSPYRRQTRNAGLSVISPNPKRGLKSGDNKKVSEEPKTPEKVLKKGRRGDSSDEEVSFHPRSLQKPKSRPLQRLMAEKGRRKSANFASDISPRTASSKLKEFKSLRSERVRGKDSSESDISPRLQSKKRIRTNKNSTANISIDLGSSDEEFTTKKSRKATTPHKSIQKTNGKISSSSDENEDTFRSAKKGRSRRPKDASGSPNVNSTNSSQEQLKNLPVPVVKLKRIEILQGESPSTTRRTSVSSESSARRSPRNVNTESKTPLSGGESLRRSSPRLKRNASSSPGVHSSKKDKSVEETSSRKGSTSSTRSKLSRKK